MQAKKSRGLGVRQQRQPGLIQERLHRQSLFNCPDLRPLGIAPPDKTSSDVNFWVVPQKQSVDMTDVYVRCRVYIEISDTDSGNSVWYEVVGSSQELADLIASIISPVRLRGMVRQAVRESDKLRERASSLDGLAVWIRRRKSRRPSKKELAAKVPSGEKSGC